MENIDYINVIIGHIQVTLTTLPTLILSLNSVDFQIIQTALVKIFGAIVYMPKSRVVKRVLWSTLEKMGCYMVLKGEDPGIL